MESEYSGQWCRWCRGPLFLVTELVGEKAKSYWRCAGTCGACGPRLDTPEDAACTLEDVCPATFPTVWAYNRACKDRDKYKAERDAYKAALDELKAALKAWGESFLRKCGMWPLTEGDLLDWFRKPRGEREP